MPDNEDILVEILEVFSHDLTRVLSLKHINQLLAEKPSGTTRFTFLLSFLLSSSSFFSCLLLSTFFQLSFNFLSSSLQLSFNFKLSLLFFLLLFTFLLTFLLPLIFFLLLLLGFFIAG